MDSLSVSSYTRITNYLKVIRFFGPLRIFNTSKRVKPSFVSATTVYVAFSTLSLTIDGVANGFFTTRYTTQWHTLYTVQVDACGLVEVSARLARFSIRP